MICGFEELLSELGFGAWVGASQKEERKGIPSGGGGGIACSMTQKCEKL